MRALFVFFAALLMCGASYAADYDEPSSFAVPSSSIICVEPDSGSGILTLQFERLARPPSSSMQTCMYKFSIIADDEEGDEPLGSSVFYGGHSSQTDHTNPEGDKTWVKWRFVHFTKEGKQRITVHIPEVREGNAQIGSAEVSVVGDFGNIQRTFGKCLISGGPAIQI